MKIGGTLRSLRTQAGMSQAEVAGRVRVSRQTISNWENNRFYPDIRSLALLAGLYGTSIDSLVAGDLESMKTVIAENDRRAFTRNAWLFGILAAVSLAVMVPAFVQDNWLALGAGAFMYGLALYFAVLVERDKGRYDVRTYREIQAFMNGVALDDIERNRSGEGRWAAIAKKLALGAGVGLAIGFAASWLARIL